MILSNVADCYTTAIATTTTANTAADNATMMSTNMPTSNQLANQEVATDFWWWPNPQTDGGMAGHQHQQISSSSSQQHQQMDDFDGFDLSLLINGTTDGYFSDSTSDCRVPTAAISATVTVHANAALDAVCNHGGDYYPSTTTETTQQQLDIQQLLSIYDDICLFSGDAPEDNGKPMSTIHRGNGVVEGDDAKTVPNYHHEQHGQLQQSLAVSTVTTTTVNTGVHRPSESTASPPAVVPCVITTTTATTKTDDTPNVAAANKTTLLRSLLTVSPTSPSPAILLPETTYSPSDSTAVVESTTEVTTAITTTDNNDEARTTITSVVEDNGSNKANKHRLLIEMLRGTSNDDVVVPTTAVRPARRRPRSAVIGTDDDEPSYGVRRRLYAPESPMDGQAMQQDNVNGDSLLLYGGAYLSATAPSWLDNMVAAAAAATTGANSANFYPADQQQNGMTRRLQQHPENRGDIDNIVDDCRADVDYCNDYNAIGNGNVFDQSTMDSSYYSTAAYSPPTAAQVPSVTPPPTSSGDPSTTTTADDIVQSAMCWKTSDVSDDYYDNLLMTVMMEAASVAPTNKDANCDKSENIGNNSCISSSCSADSRNGHNNSSCNNRSGDKAAVSNKISSVDSGCDDTTAIDSDDSDCTLVQLELQRPVSAVKTSSTKSVATVAVKPTKITSNSATANTTSSSSSSSSSSTSSSTSSSQHIHLWQFLKELLATEAAEQSCCQSSVAADDDHVANQNNNGSPLSPASSTSSCSTDYNNSGLSVATRPSNASGNQQQQMIRWLDRKEGVFKIEDSQAVARLWGLRKNRPLMNYDKLSRSLRQYYKKGIMRKTVRSQRLVYQFCHPYNA